MSVNLKNLYLKNSNLIILSFYIYLCDIQLIYESLIIDSWYIALVSWAILSLITSLLISLLRKKYSKENPDINDY